MKSIKRFRALSRREKKSILFKYALFQLPETFIVMIALLFLDEWMNIPCWLLGGFAALWIVKDVIAFPFLWPSFTPPISENQYPRIGTEGIALEKCDPYGYVRILGEYWRAIATDGISINEGERIVVVGRRGRIVLIRVREREVHPQDPR